MNGMDAHEGHDAETTLMETWDTMDTGCGGSGIAATAMADSIKPLKPNGYKHVKELIRRPLICSTSFSRINKAPMDSFLKN